MEEIYLLEVWAIDEKRTSFDFFFELVSLKYLI